MISIKRMQNKIQNPTCSLFFSSASLAWSSSSFLFNSWIHRIKQAILIVILERVKKYPIHYKMYLKSLKKINSTVFHHGGSINRNIYSISTFRWKRGKFWAWCRRLAPRILVISARTVIHKQWNYRWTAYIHELQNITNSREASTSEERGREK